MRSWKRTLVVCVISQLCSTMGFSFVFPFLPFYVRVLGVTDEAALRFWAGVVGAASGATMAIFAPIWGSLADRHGRKLMVQRSMFGAAAVITLMALARNVYQLAVMRLIQGALTGTVSASVALVSSVTPSRHAGFSLGLTQMAAFVGHAIGPLLGGMLADHLGFKATFYIASAILFVSGLMVTFGAEEEFTPPPETAKGTSDRLRDVLKLQGFISLITMLFFIRFSGTVVMPVLPLFVEDLAPVKENVASLTGKIIAIVALGAGISAPVIGRYSDRLGHKRVMTACMVVAGAAFIPQALARNIPELVLFRILVGMATAGTLPAIHALINHMVPRHNYGKAYGLTQSVSCFGMALGPFTGGAVASLFGLRLPFFLTGLFMLSAAAMAAWRVKLTASQREDG